MSLIKRRMTSQVQKAGREKVCGSKVASDGPTDNLCVDTRLKASSVRQEKDICQLSLIPGDAIVTRGSKLLKPGDIFISGKGRNYPAEEKSKSRESSLPCNPSLQVTRTGLAESEQEQWTGASAKMMEETVKGEEIEWE
ncbi:hypothetical protein RRG08_031813 [Elysia crispata]|uniref:Uncharacterized protein n=1 Tax=Elysia crispata TaxID=231223 RepID=A0AAE1CSX9_9GAST|nr:hypothetical protein RRG08_031813 [Elysia crispata]